MDGFGNPVPVLDDPGRTRFHVMDPVERKKRLREQGERGEEAGVLVARAVGAVTLSEEARLLEELRRGLEGVDDPRERRRILEEWKDRLVQRGLKGEEQAEALAGRVLRDLESEPPPQRKPLFKW